MADAESMRKEFLTLFGSLPSVHRMDVDVAIARAIERIEKGEPVLSECPARTGIPIEEKRCAVHTARGAHECRREPTNHFQHTCRCGVEWWSTSPISDGPWLHVGDGESVKRPPDDALPDANERAIQRGLGEGTE